MNKLQKTGVKSRILKWFHNSITHICAIKSKNKISKYKKTRRGLPKEEDTISTLINVMISDLPAQSGEIKNVPSALFADDLVIWISLPKQ
jgi:hypothetical protein